MRPLLTSLCATAGKETPVLRCHFLYYRGSSFYQDRLGTIIAKTQKNWRFLRTFMSYRKPHHGTVSGRVRQAAGNRTWITSEAAGHDLDTSYGPVNFIGQ